MTTESTCIRHISGMATLALALCAAQMALAEPPTVTTGGDAGWTTDGDGIWQSGAITHNQSSWLQLDIADAPCKLSFQWKTSSEEGFDHLHCHLDGTEAVSPISGVMDGWETVSLLIAESGSHVVRLEYAKDGSDSDGEDCAWVKNWATAAVELRVLPLDAQGGHVDISETTVADGCAVGALPDAFWNGEGSFRFLGWFTEEEDGEQVTADSVCQEEWTKLFAHWHEVNAPGNDDFANATAISGTEGSIAGTTIDSTRESTILIGYESFDSTVWYQWTAPGDGVFAFEFSDTDSERDWSAYLGTASGYYDEEEAWAERDVQWGRIVVHATAGQVWWLEVASFQNEECDFVLSWKQLHPPANDNFADATTISGASGSVGGTTADSTRATPDLIPDRMGARWASTVWYQWTAPGDGVFAFEVADTDSERNASCCLGTTTGYDGEAEAWTACNVQWDRLLLQATAGQVWWIEMANYPYEECDFVLSWKKLHPPANDDFVNASMISGAAGTITGSIIDSTRETHDLIPDTNNGGCTSTVWYQWTAPGDGVFAFKVSDTDSEMNRSCYVGLTTGYDEEEETWGGCTSQWGELVLHATAGQVWWIALANYPYEEFDFVLSWKELHPPSNDDFANASTISGATGTITGSIIDSTREFPDLIPDTENGSCTSTVWYQWTAPGDGVFTFKVSDTDSERDWSCYVGATTGYDEEEGTWGERKSQWRELAVHATAGQVWWIETASYPSEEFDFVLSWKELHPPANDDFAGAMAISGTTGSVEGTTIDSTRESKSLIEYSSYASTVWYQWTAPGDGVFAFRVADSDSERNGSCYVGATTGYDDEEGAWSSRDVQWEQVRIHATAGQSWWFEVASTQPTEFDFVLSWKELHPPANDDFADAAMISGATGSAEGTTVDSTRESKSLIEYSSYASTVWYQWTAPGDGVFVFRVSDTDSERGWTCYVGATTGYDDKEGAWSSRDVQWEQVRIHATAGQSWWFEVASDESTEIDFVLSWKEIHPPANDDFAEAATISGTAGSVEGTTIDSTKETPLLGYDTCGSTVWYQWTAPGDGVYEFVVSDTDSERGRSCYVGATTGYDDEEGTWIARNVQWGKVLVHATAGETWWFEIASRPSEEFDFVLSWQELHPPANDNFANATVISGTTGTATGSNAAASVEEGEPLPTEKQNIWYFETTASVWWKWTAPQDGSVSVSTAGSDFDTVLGVYTGSSVENLTTIAANDEYNDVSTSFVTFDATAGTTYYFAVGGYTSRAGNIVLGWQYGDGSGDVVVHAGNGKTVTVPGAWLAANTTRGAEDVAANGRLKVWECYVLGLNPEGTEDFRIVSFPMKADGTPDLANLGVSPDPATWNVPATLQVKGRTTLSETGPWDNVPDGGAPEYRFFSLEVILP